MGQKHGTQLQFNTFQYLISNIEQQEALQRGLRLTRFWWVSYGFLLPQRPGMASGIWCQGQRCAIVMAIVLPATCLAKQAATVQLGVQSDASKR